MKKLPILFMTTAMLCAGILTGCSGSSRQETKPPADQQSAVSTAQNESDKQISDDNRDADNEVPENSMTTDMSGTTESTDSDFADDVPLTGEADDRTNDVGQNLKNHLSEEEASNIALEQVSGATKSDLRIHKDTEDGKEIYEGSIVYHEMEYDFEIDASTGEIIEWESESIYDD
ncbi:MAG: PepSY domain-containing protein [Eubacteriales bacterium]|nr:PepSY domain-containing protein [Eubacteriales bacterium]